MVALLCEDYPSLYDRQISKIKYEFPPELGELKEGTVKNFQLRKEYGGGIIALRNLDDPSKYQSAEFAAIAVDELTKSPKDTFDFLRFRLRWPGVVHPKFVGATNPGGKGHAWVKKLWIERDFPAELDSVKDQFAFVQAKASDNPHLNESYYNSLKTLPPDMARKFAEGDWDVYTGQYFPQFGKRHVMPKADALALIQPWHTRWISGDWGYEHPHCFHWHAMDEHKRVITYREQWGRHVNETDLGKLITKRTGQEKMSAFPFSWDAFGRLSKGTKKAITTVIGENLPQGMPRPHPADAAPGTRVSGWRLMAQMLDAGQWLISDDCPQLIKCLPTLIRDEDNEEDVLKVDFAENEIGDDPADSARMGLQHMLGAPIKPRSVIRQELLASHDSRIDRLRELRMGRA